MKTTPSFLFTSLFCFSSPLLWAEPTPAVEAVVAPTAPSVLNSVPKTVKDFKVIEEAMRKHLAEARAATVVLEGKTGSGSGVIISPDGLILTAAHVASRPGRKFEVILGDGRRVKAEALGLSEFSDAGMARLLEKGEYPFVALEKARSCEVGEWCFALGHPSGYDEDRGVVLRVGRVISRSGSTVRTDCELLPGDSGGPLFSMEGKVIAIHSAISGRLDDNFHVDSKAFLKNWDRFLEKKVYRQAPDKTKGFLGAVVEERPEGVVVVLVTRDSAASEAGLKSGDVLLRIGEDSLLDKESFYIAIRSKNPGDEVILHVRRLTKAIELKAKLGAWPE